MTIKKHKEKQNNQKQTKNKNINNNKNHLGAKTERQKTLKNDKHKTTNLEDN